MPPRPRSIPDPQYRYLYLEDPNLQIMGIQVVPDLPEKRSKLSLSFAWLGERCSINQVSKDRALGRTTPCAGHRSPVA